MRERVVIAKKIIPLGVGHHPFSKKYEFTGYFDEPVPCLIATDYKAPKTVLELHYETNETEEFGMDDKNVLEEGFKENELTEQVQGIDKKSFKYAELFAGILGFGTALDDLGGEAVFISEIDKYAQQAITLMGKGDLLHGDITKINETEIPEHDLLVGGYPCQSFSLAGRRLGFEDMRGTLFFEIVRIAKEKRPKALLLENVKGLVSHDKGNTLSVMLHALNEIGYVLDINIMNSKYFDVPQNRERIFIVALREDLIEAEEWRETDGNTMLPKAKRRLVEEGLRTFNFDWPEQKVVTKRLRDVLLPNVDEKYYLSEEKTASLIKQLEKTGLRDTEGIAVEGNLKSDSTLIGSRERVWGENGVAGTLNATDYKQPRPIAFTESPDMVGHINVNGHDYLKRVYNPNAQSPTLATNGGGNTETKIAEEVRPVLTPERLEKRQNGRRFKENEEEAFTLTSQDRHGVAFGQFPTYRIRKLTPLEAFRLQSFSDEIFELIKYETEEVSKEILSKNPNHKKKQLFNGTERIERMSDSQLYKQAGNAVTVNVVREIGKRLLKYL